MIRYSTRLLKFDQQGEKTGWTYIEIPADLAEKLYPGNKKTFRVKGKLDHFPISQVAALPMGNGSFIIPINAAMRRGLAKKEGAMIILQLQREEKEKPVSAELLECLKDEPAAAAFFKTLPAGHQRYFSNWIDSAKTEATKTKRISIAINALARKLGYGEMIREDKQQRKEGGY